MLQYIYTYFKYFESIHMCWDFERLLAAASEASGFEVLVFAQTGSCRSVSPPGMEI